MGLSVSSVPSTNGKRRPPTEAQRRARARNWGIFSLKGLLGSLVPARRAFVEPEDAADLAQIEVLVRRILVRNGAQP